MFGVKKVGCFVLFTLTLTILSLSSGSGCDRQHIDINLSSVENQQNLNDIEFSERLLRHSLAVTGLDSENNRRILGSGTYLLINDIPYILTAAHIYDALSAMPNGGKNSICFYNIYTYDMECTDAILLDLNKILRFRIDRDRDEALIPLRHALNNAVPASYRTNETLRYGQEVWMVGNPAGRALLVSSGQVRGFGYKEDSNNNNGPEYVHTDVEGTFGSSGSGVYTKDGILIGVYHHVAAVRVGLFGPVIPADGMGIFSVIPPDFLSNLPDA